MYVPGQEKVCQYHSEHHAAIEKAEKRIGAKMYIPGQEKVCQYHSEHHAAIEKAETGIEKLYTKINTAEKQIVKLETDLENMKSRAFIYSVAASIVASLIFAIIQYMLK
jgi:hypothetical protein